jgi:GntR family transcriptional regulator
MEAAMFFEINPTNGVAIFEQIARQVKYAVANGALRVGELVPSVRELATKLAVNPNTVARAYRDLQADGFLVQV